VQPGSPCNHHQAAGHWHQRGNLWSTLPRAITLPMPMPKCSPGGRDRQRERVLGITLGNLFTPDYTLWSYIIIVLTCQKSAIDEVITPGAEGCAVTTLPHRQFSNFNCGAQTTDGVQYDGFGRCLLGCGVCIGCGLNYDFARDRWPRPMASPSTRA
jgi:hypothetical protein